jgi:pyruvate formate lyase activating enzyme
MKEALFYKKLPGKSVNCRLCPRNCTIPAGGRGNCGVRENRDGTLYSLVYGKAISANVDPIEKKPLFHFAPGTRCLSVATVGCNLHCSFCQNWEISQPQEVFGKDLPPEEIVRIAKGNNVPGIAYTYTEPTIFFEYAYDTMKLARKAGLYNVWVSNGYTNPETAGKVAKYLDAINVDMKGDLRFYSKLCGVPNEEPVKEALKVYRKAGVWIEVTNLVIPGFNDKGVQVTRLVEWVKENLGEETPLHFSRFYPHYRLSDRGPTPEKTLDMCYSTARGLGMKWVYVGNVYGHEGESTLCPKCGQVLMKRTGYETITFKSRCDKCGIEIPLGGKKWTKS